MQNVELSPVFTNFVVKNYTCIMDFDKLTQRRGTGSYKWDTPEDLDVLPLWVADMDFTTAPAIVDALRRRVEHGIFGYTKVPDEYYAAVVDWFGSRHGWTIDPSHIIYTSGVVPALSAIIKGLTQPGDKVIVQTPAYNCFFSSIRNNGCQLAANELIYNADGTYTIDFDNLQELAADSRTRLMILCNPHNPAARVWTREELLRIGRICLDNSVVVVSDEIHCELTSDGFQYTPFASLSHEMAWNSVCCNSPSKAFNIAGLQIANVVAPDPVKRTKIDRAINDNEVCDVNPFGIVGLIAAYREGAEWLDEVKRYLWDNYLWIKQQFERHLPALKLTPLEATYLLWVNITPTGLNADQLCDALLREARVMLSPGTIYGPGGENFVRINLATQRSRLEEAFNRMLPVFNNF